MKFGQIIGLLVTAIVCAPAAAVAGDAPYAPERQSVADLVVTDRFDDPPLAFPWDEVAVDRVAEDRRVDFAITYDVDFQTVYDRLREAYGDSEDFIALRSDALRYIDIPELRITGHQLGSDSGRLTVGHPDMEATFSVLLEADGSQTTVTIQNRLRSRQFSGFVPARVGFQPVDAAPVPLRWD